MEFGFNFLRKFPTRERNQWALEVLIFPFGLVPLTATSEVPVVLPVVLGKEDSGELCVACGQAQVLPCKHKAPDERQGGENFSKKYLDQFSKLNSIEKKNFTCGGNYPNVSERKSRKVEARQDGHEEHDGEGYLGVEAEGSLVEDARGNAPGRPEDKAAEPKIPRTLPRHFSVR